MSSRVSPFAALTGAEKQIKWLEVQSIRLPYVQGRLERDSVEAVEKARQSEKPDEKTKANSDAESPMPVQSVKAEARASFERAEFQRTRHKQYDAVIARMRQAEKNAKGYQALP